MKDPSGKIFLTKNGPELLVINGTVQNPVENPLTPAKVAEKPFKPLWIQHGTSAGQRMHNFNKNMKSEALGIDDAEVVTREKATEAICIIESAIFGRGNEYGCVPSTLGSLFRKYRDYE